MHAQPPSGCPPPGTTVGVRFRISGFASRVFIFFIMDETQPRPLWCGRIRNMQNAWSCLAEIENFRWPSNLFRCFWRLCVPILYHGLMAFFIQLRVPSFWWLYYHFFLQMKNGHVGSYFVDKIIRNIKVKIDYKSDISS